MIPPEINVRHWEARRPDGILVRPKMGRNDLIGDSERRRPLLAIIAQIIRGDVHAVGFAAIL
jgi:hypothetical protein